MVRVVMLRMLLAALVCGGLLTAALGACAGPGSGWWWVMVPWLVAAPAAALLVFSAALPEWRVRTGRVGYVRGTLETWLGGTLAAAVAPGVAMLLVQVTATGSVDAAVGFLSASFGGVLGEPVVMTMVLTAPLPFVCALRVRCGRATMAERLTLTGLCAALALAAFTLLPVDRTLRTMLLFGFAAPVFTEPVVILYAVSDSLARALRWPVPWPEPSASENTSAAPAEPAHWVDRLVTGGRGFVGGIVAWTVAFVALLLLKLPPSAFVAAAAATVTHIAVAQAWPALLRRSDCAERAIRYCRWELARPQLDKPNRRRLTDQLALALLAAGRPEEAGEQARAAVADEPKGMIQQMQVLRLAVPFIQAGEGETAIELLTRVPRDGWRRSFATMATLNLSAAYAAADRAQEAKDLLEPIAPESLKSRLARAVLLNNLASFELTLDDGDPARALELAGQAHALVPRHPHVRYTLGAAHLMNDGAPDQALELLTAGPDEATASTSAKVWREWFRGIACERLGRPQDALRHFRASAAGGDAHAMSRRAAAHLARLGEAPEPPTA